MNISEEYERLFGPARKVDLFDPEEDYYNVLRQEIISAKGCVKSHHGKLFNDITLQPYPLYALEQVEKNAIEEGRHLFYLRRSTYDAFDYCYAIGYYLSTNNIFFVLPFSYIAPTGARNGLRLKRDGEHLYLTEQKSFSSIEKATSFILGKDTTTYAWKDRMGKTFYDCYPQTVDDLQALHKGPVSEKPSVTTECNVHMFYIIDDRNGIKASGYYEPATNYFYVLKGSIVSTIISSILLDEETIKARNRFITEACVYSNGFCQVKKDAKCRTPSAAATYVLGRKVNGWLAWKDYKGCTLKDIFKK